MFKTTKAKLILIFILITFFAYCSSLANPFIWDDDQFIRNNIFVQQFNVPAIFTQNTTAGGEVLSNYYRPLTSLSFAIDAQIWGQNPLPFHLTNLALHIGAGILLFLLLDALGISELPAFFISLFFLIFPTQTEAVTYINSRGDSMFAFLILGSFLFFIKGLKNRKRLFYIISAILFGLSILGKETALFGLPMFGVIFWIYIQQQQKHFKKYLTLAEKLFFLSITGIAGSYFILRMTLLNFKNTLNFYEVPDIYSTHLFVRIFTFCKILFVYLGLLIWPYPLHMERSVNYVTTFYSWWVIAACGLVGVLIAFGIFVYRKNHNPWILFGTLWSTIFLTPVSGIIPINGLLYEHWLYLPIIGFWIILYGMYKVIAMDIGTAKTVRVSMVIKKILISFGIFLSILYVILTVRQNNIWSDPVIFYRYTIHFAPNSTRLHNNLGISLAAIGDNYGAIAEYKKAIAIAPDNVEAYNNMGFSYLLLGDYDTAEKVLLQTLKMSPNFFLPRGNLVKVYLATKQYDKARAISGNNPIVEQLIQSLQKGNDKLK